MQAQAIFEAAAQVAKGKKRIRVEPEVMVPLVGFSAELTHQLEIIHRVAAQVMERKNVRFRYLVGTMVEVPRAALRAGEIARIAQFFSFGTNDLTQTTLGMSRDDSASFLPVYRDLEIIAKVSGDQALSERLEDVSGAIRAIWASHVKAGFKLSQLVLHELPSQLPTLDEEPRRIGFTFGAGWIVSVEEIADASEDRPYWETNRLLFDEEM